MSALWPPFFLFAIGFWTRERWKKTICLSFVPQTIPQKNWTRLDLNCLHDCIMLLGPPKERVLCAIATGWVQTGKNTTRSSQARDVLYYVQVFPLNVLARELRVFPSFFAVYFLCKELSVGLVGWCALENAFGVICPISELFGVKLWLHWWRKHVIISYQKSIAFFRSYAAAACFLKNCYQLHITLMNRNLVSNVMITIQGNVFRQVVLNHEWFLLLEIVYDCI